MRTVCALEEVTKTYHDQFLRSRIEVAFLLSSARDSAKSFKYELGNDSSVIVAVPPIWKRV